MPIRMNTEELRLSIIRCMYANVVPFIKSSPGLGKSAVVVQIANEFDLIPIELILSLCDPTDLTGFPTKGENGKATYMPLDTFPLATDKIPEGKNGWVLFLDEFNTAPKTIQALAYKLVHERMIGGRKLHPEVRIVCAGNLDTDDAITHPMSTALQSRLSHLFLKEDADVWLRWAWKAGIHPLVTSYVQARPANIYNFATRGSAFTFSCPRTLENLSKLLIANEGTSMEDMLAEIQGTVGEGVGNEFYGFSQLTENVPTLKEILLNPTTIEIPSRNDIIYILTGNIASGINHADTLDKAMPFVKRLPGEFQVITLKQLIARNPALGTCKAIAAWQQEIGLKYF